MVLVAMAMSMAIVMRLAAMVRRNLTVNPSLISSEVPQPAEGLNVMRTQVMLTHTATFRSVARNSHHTNNLTVAVAIALAAAPSGQNIRVLKCGSMPIVTSVAIVSS